MAWQAERKQKEALQQRHGQASGRVGKGNDWKEKKRRERNVRHEGLVEAEEDDMGNISEGGRWRTNQKWK